MSHAPEHDPHGDDKIHSYLAWAQVIVTVVILGGIGSLAYVAGLTSTKGGHAGADSTAAPAALTASADLGALMTSTPELVAQGKSLFAVNCVSCHGAGGAGDGAAAAALNPKPRNFTSDQGWKYGRGVARIARTLTEGSPGTAMAAFQMIPMPERIAIAHYVQSLNATPAQDQKADLDWLGIGAPGAASGGAAAAAATPVAGPTIPIEKAMALLAEPAHAAGAVTSPAAEDTGEGARLYAARCASCHGSAGQGGVRVRMLGSAPYAYVVTESFGSPRGDWAVNPATFDRHVTLGLTGAMMPGNGDLSRASLRELYSYTQTLRARQEAAGRGRSS
ncbi:MAG TPA: c-type cytochrome [Candidatus Eisenbacteria bacterium]|nr:c-type cytochrome [Candidatus Eisenbacteria bacterium]